MTQRPPDDRAGFSLVEVLIAIAITVSVTALACALAIDAQATWRADAERADLQQRVRVASDTLTHVLLESGAGPHGGPARGPLLRILAPVLPRRTGLRGADAPATFRTDAFSVVRALPEAEHATLLVAAPAGATTVEIAPSPSCALPGCGFSDGATILLADTRGNSDLFTVVGIAALTLSVRHHGSGTAATYPAGSPVFAVESTIFYVDSRAHVLRRYDGDASDLPLVDDVVGMDVSYYGDPHPPMWPKPPAREANCLYDADGSYAFALMPDLQPEGPAVQLTEDLATDGPWCGSGANQFDADLLRVRRIRVTLRLQASDPAVRGRDPALFRIPGTTRRSAAMVPDATIAIDVTSRNLRQGW